MKKIKTDFLIIGSGLAGLFAAYHAAKKGKVAIVTKSDITYSSSWLAQGGIAAALAPNDSTEMHFHDTITAGRGLCDENLVRILVEEGKAAVEELVKIGMDFDKKGASILFGLEGGHSRRRVLHASGSATGEHLIRFLFSLIKELPNVTIYYNTQALKLIELNNEIFGVHALSLDNMEKLTFYARNTLLATGGYSRIFSQSTNPGSSIGEGIWLAQNAGAEIRDMEFVQFHPTAFYSESGNTFLISEAVRGEGAILLNQDFERFMPKYHHDAELAPRDVVSQAIYSEINLSEKPFLFLDARHLEEENFKSKFPNIFNMLMANGLNPLSDLIPVTPAAHYSIGGVKTDEYGRTNLKRLFVAGESASTGIHGANRLASNSLLECLVFSKRVVSALNNEAIETPEDVSWNNFRVDNSFSDSYSNLKDTIASIMTSNAGILRNRVGLQEGLTKLENLQRKIKYQEEYFSILSTGILTIARDVLLNALKREESRGAHQRSDFPVKSETFNGNFILKNEKIIFERRDNDKTRLFTEVEAAH